MRLGPERVERPGLTGSRSGCAQPSRAELGDGVHSP